MSRLMFDLTKLQENIKLDGLQQTPIVDSDGEYEWLDFKE